MSGMYQLYIYRNTYILCIQTPYEKSSFLSTNNLIIENQRKQQKANN